MCDALAVVPLGKNTTFSDGPVFGRFSSVRMKSEVAPESTIIVEAFL